MVAVVHGFGSLMLKGRILGGECTERNPLKVQSFLFKVPSILTWLLGPGGLVTVGCMYPDHSLAVSHPCLPGGAREPREGGNPEQVAAAGRTVQEPRVAPQLRWHPRVLALYLVSCVLQIPKSLEMT